MNDTAISIDNLQVIRGGRAVLPGISAKIGAGSVTGLLGPSGSGKSTLIRSIVGVQKIQSGTIDILGLPAGCSQLRSRVSYVTQAPSVYSDLTVRENLQYFAAILSSKRRSSSFLRGHDEHAQGPDSGKTDIDNVLTQVGLSENEHRRVDQLSGGQQARVSLATAMLGSPEVLVLDEPTVGLDPILRRDLWNTFRGLAANGATLLVSSHVMDEAERCDDLILLREGRILAQASPQQLCARTRTDRVESAFLALVEQGQGEK